MLLIFLIVVFLLHYICPLAIFVVLTTIKEKVKYACLSTLIPILDDTLRNIY